MLLGGGRMSSEVTRDTTHLIVSCDRGKQCSPQQLLEAVVQQAGGAAAATALGQALHDHTLQLVTARWVTAETTCTSVGNERLEIANLARERRHDTGLTRTQRAGDCHLHRKKNQSLDR